MNPAGIAVLGVGSLRELALPLGVAFAATVFGSGGQPMVRGRLCGDRRDRRDDRRLHPLDDDALVGR